MPTAYSYQRFSDLTQGAGDSLRRQSALRDGWLTRNPSYHLDESLRPDKGISAFKGRNIEIGALGRFLATVKKGKVAKGSVLLIESLDRLSRNEVGEALTLFLDILKSGVKIVTLSPEREFTKQTINDIGVIIGALIDMCRAHEESAVKSARVGAAWSNRRNNISTEKLTSKCPFWLSLPTVYEKRNHGADRSKFIVNREAVTVLKRIFKMSLAGHGALHIARTLNAENVPTFRKAQKWDNTRVGIILNDRRVLGEFQPMQGAAKTGRVACGPLIPDYFPRIIDDQTFYAAQTEKKKRTHQGKRSKQVTNLLTGMCFDVRDKSNMIIVIKQQTSPVRLVSSAAKNGKRGSTYLAFRYEPIEQAVLRFCSELSVKDILGHVDDSDALAERISALEGQLSEVSDKLDATTEAIVTRPDSVALLTIIEKLENRQQDLASQLETAKQSLHTASADDTLTDTMELIGALKKTKGDKLVDLRTHLQSRLRDLIDKIWMLVQGSRYDRQAWLQIHLKSGRVRQLYVTYADNLRQREVPGSFSVRGSAIGSAGTIPEKDLPASEDLRNWPDVDLGTDGPAPTKAARKKGKAKEEVAARKAGREAAKQNRSKS